MESNHDCQDKSDEELAVLSLTARDYFGCLVKRYEAKLAAYLRRLFGLSQEDIEDILQETFIKVYLNLNDFDKDLKFSSWIYRIAHNQAVSSFRKMKTHGWPVSLETNSWQELAGEVNLMEEISREQDKAILAAALAQLPFKYREALVLKFLAEKSYKEISDILKKPEGTVATLINRGKKLLAAELKNKYGKT
jgi:RNA polymerase sigma-70 factor (ECF subfamily)